MSEWCACMPSRTCPTPQLGKPRGALPALMQRLRCNERSQQSSTSLPTHFLRSGFVGDQLKWKIRAYSNADNSLVDTREGEITLKIRNNILLDDGAHALTHAPHPPRPGKPSAQTVLTSASSDAATTLPRAITTQLHLKLPVTTHLEHPWHTLV